MPWDPKYEENQKRKQAEDPEYDAQVRAQRKKADRKYRLKQGRQRFLERRLWSACDPPRIRRTHKCK